MTFQITPILSQILTLYNQPISFDRFQEYLKILQGNTGNDLEVPIAGFNPMAKGHALEKLDELITLKAEQIATEAVSEVNDKWKDKLNNETFKVSLNLSDDLKGGWTNRFTSDYDSKFRINALVARKFCTPIFWTSENFTEEIIRERTLEYVYRTIYWMTDPKPETLRQHIEQEVFVAEQVGVKTDDPAFDFASADKFFNEHRDDDNYNLVFNFLYGDAACRSLEFSTFGNTQEMTGFRYAGMKKRER